MEVERRWTITKSISLPTIITLAVGLILNVVVFVWVLSDAVSSRDAQTGAMERRIERLEKNDAATDAANRLVRLEERQAAMEERIADMRDLLERMDAKLDRVVERTSK